MCTEHDSIGISRVVHFPQLICVSLMMVAIILNGEMRVTASAGYANGAVQSTFGPDTQASPPSGASQDPCEDGDCEIVGTHMFGRVEHADIAHGDHGFGVGQHLSNGIKQWAVIRTHYETKNGYTDFTLGCKIGKLRKKQIISDIAVPVSGSSVEFGVGIAMRPASACLDSDSPAGGPSCSTPPKLYWHCVYDTDDTGEPGGKRMNVRSYSARIDSSARVTFASHGFYSYDDTSNNKMQVHITENRFYYYTQDANGNPPDNPPGVQPEICNRCVQHTNLRNWADETNNVSPWPSGSYVSHSPVHVFDKDGHSSFRVCMNAVPGSPCAATATSEPTPSSTTTPTPYMPTSTPSPGPSPTKVPTATPTSTPDPEYTHNCSGGAIDGPINIVFVDDAPPNPVMFKFQNLVGWTWPFVGSAQCFVSGGNLHPHHRQRADDPALNRFHARFFGGGPIGNRTVRVQAHEELIEALCGDRTVWHLVTSFDSARDEIALGFSSSPDHANHIVTRDLGLTEPSPQCDGSELMSIDGIRYEIGGNW